MQNYNTLRIHEKKICEPPFLICEKPHGGVAKRNMSSRQELLDISMGVDCPNKGGNLGRKGGNLKKKDVGRGIKKAINICKSGDFSVPLQPNLGYTTRIGIGDP